MTLATELARRLSQGDVVLLDGGVGTELQARGVVMDDAIWCGAANLSDVDAVQAMHEAYISAGVDVITTNTFACNRAAFESCGLGDEVGRANRNAVGAALRARDAVADTPVAIAGSISPLCPVTMEPPGAELSSHDGGHKPVRRPTLEHFREQASILADAGVDLIALEMMNSVEYGSAAVQAALETGLPVWLGVTAVRLPDGSLASGEEVPRVRPSFESLVAELASPGVAAVNCMHAKMSVVPEALEIMRRHFEGPCGAYPEAGDWSAPNWTFTDVSDAEFVATALGWIQQGARVVGGCCGIRPSHLQALAAALSDRSE